MVKSERMAQFVDNFLFESRHQYGFVVRQAIELILEPMSGHHGCDAIELRFAKNKREDRNIEIHIDNQYVFYVLFGSLIDQQRDESSGIILSSRLVKCAIDLNSGGYDVCCYAKNLIYPIGNPFELIGFEFQSIDDVNRRSHYGFFKPYFSILLYSVTLSIWRTSAEREMFQ